jgi:hypothetical protein
LTVPPFKVGDRVTHPRFGEGLVLAVSGEGEQVAYKISFSQDGVQRKLLGRLSQLAAGTAAEGSGKASRSGGRS